MLRRAPAVRRRRWRRRSRSPTRSAMRSAAPSCRTRARSITPSGEPPRSVSLTLVHEAPDVDRLSLAAGRPAIRSPRDRRARPRPAQHPLAGPVAERPRARRRARDGEGAARQVSGRRSGASVPREGHRARCRPESLFRPLGERSRFGLAARAAVARDGRHPGTAGLGWASSAGWAGIWTSGTGPRPTNRCRWSRPRSRPRRAAPGPSRP